MQEGVLRRNILIVLELVLRGRLGLGQRQRLGLGLGPLPDLVSLPFLQTPSPIPRHHTPRRCLLIRDLSIRPAAIAALALRLIARLGVALGLEVVAHVGVGDEDECQRDGEQRADEMRAEQQVCKPSLPSANAQHKMRRVAG